MPHGTLKGKSGLDIILSTSIFTKEIGVFFVSDGVFQILSGQNPSKYFLYNYIVTYKILLLYNIKKFYICKEDLNKRGCFSKNSFILPVEIISFKKIKFNLLKYNVILNF